MGKKNRSLKKLLTGKYLNLYKRAESVIQSSEDEFNRLQGQHKTEYLWEHSRHVAAYANKLALKEGVNPTIPVIAALFHDAGKFYKGEYHADKIPEEEHSIKIAETILTEESLPGNIIEEILSAISTLYHDENPDLNSRIVQDSDRLSKLGNQGISNFFIKGALRGKNLEQLIYTSLSRELTYIISAPHSMMTETGRKIARRLIETKYKIF